MFSHKEWTDVKVKKNHSYLFSLSAIYNIKLFVNLLCEIFFFQITQFHIKISFTSDLMHIRKDLFG
jgi:hypothetical protein